MGSECFSHEHLTLHKTLYTPRVNFPGLKSFILIKTPISCLPLVNRFTSFYTMTFNASDDTLYVSIGSLVGFTGLSYTPYVFSKVSSGFYGFPCHMHIAVMPEVSSMWTSRLTVPDHRSDAPAKKGLY